MVVVVVVGGMTAGSERATDQPGSQYHRGNPHRRTPDHSSILSTRHADGQVARSAREAFHVVVVFDGDHVQLVIRP